MGGATSSPVFRFLPIAFQSTLPVGGATRYSLFSDSYLAISIHAPRGGSDLTLVSLLWESRAFQSTLPVGGATSGTIFPRIHNTDFNPRSPWGERPTSRHHVTPIVPFQSTLPVGGATLMFRLACLDPIISIHAPRGGSDQVRIEARDQGWNFNPRSPWGERRVPVPP